MKASVITSEENKLYRKRGNRYVPVSYEYDRDILSDGIWYVRANGSHITNGDYIKGLFKISDKPLFDNFKQFCDMEDIAESIMNSSEFRDWMAARENKGWSINEVIHFAVAYMAKRAQEQKK